MEASANEKGQSFEAEVGESLARLQIMYPTRVTVEKHPRVALYDGSERIPDFGLSVRLPFGEFKFLIECQDRKRSSPAIAEKIYKLKTHSQKNRVIFVHAGEIPSATRVALEKQGDTCLQIDAFIDFLRGIADTIDQLRNPKQNRDENRRDDNSGPIFECIRMR